MVSHGYAGDRVVRNRAAKLLKDIRHDGISEDNLLQHIADDYPVVLAQNEGVLVQVLTAMGAAGVGRLYVNLELAETAAF